MNTEGSAVRGQGDERRADLLGYLRSRRWFGEKSRAIRFAEIVDRIPVHWHESDGEFVVARVRVQPEEGEATHYQLFLRRDDPTFADALEDPAFRRGLIAAFGGGSTCENRGVRWVIQSQSEVPFKAPTDAPVVLSRAEQSNTSLFVGTQAVLKMYRKVTPGIHPDLECTRFLTVERRFLHTPALLGSIHFVDGKGAWAAGMLQELVPGAKDAWSHAIECSGEWFANGGEQIPFVGDAERLGVITRSMHETLASGDPGSHFERRDASAEDVQRWTRATAEMAKKALSSAGRERDVKAVQRRIEALAARIGDDRGARIRVHGDYHLGQVLRSVTNAFLVVDFEGEPARPLAERRQPHSPLKDVAGMLRSFAYAAAVSSRALGDPAEERRLTWELATREAFLKGYFADSSRPTAENRKPQAILPRSRDSMMQLVSLFEMEKALYELQYELDNRPDWRWIPEAAIDRLLQEEQPNAESDTR